MDDLISRNTLKQSFYKDKRNTYTLEEVAEIIDSIPTAYDVESVARQINAIMDDESIRFADQVVRRAVSIVKGAVKDE
jgi:ribosomal protein S7